MPDVIDLLEELIAGPDLRGAACVHHRDVFDACTVRGCSRAYDDAVRICASCPALAACRSWVLSLPRRKRPVGVTGRLIRGSRT